MSVSPADLDTRTRQRNASDPRVSAWVSANAGSGKTTVLRNRVLRLLLSGAEPGGILCLTFTKAAAAEMSNRVFAELARWVGLDDEALRAAIFDISGDAPSPVTLEEARRLFARAIETPGGLRVDTIHGFCTRLLQTFAFEANVPARFAVLEEAQARELLSQAQNFVLSRALSGEDAALSRAMALVAEHVGATDFAGLAEMALGLPVWKGDAATEPGFLAGLHRELSHALNIAPHLSRSAIENEIWSGAQSELAKRARAAWSHGAVTDGRRAEAMATLMTLAPPERLGAYTDLLLTRDPEARALRPPKSLSTAGARKADPQIEEKLQAEAWRLCQLLDRINAVAARERSFALISLMRAVRARFARLKSERGALDFDDLIVATRRLLARASAAFVLYKLDAAIEHLLVDEAQDTNSEYWDILRALTAEFTSGGGARAGRLRTVFAVGDEKQSIYGFQGAEPKTFGIMRDQFAKDYAPLARERERELYRKVTLNLSFRSTQDVLDAVDAVFAVEQHFEGLTSDGEQPQAHVSYRRGEPGVVDLWPVVAGDENVTVDPFRRPELGPILASAEVKLARRIAGEIQRWTAQGCDLGRAVQAGDVLILVRRRGKMFEAVIRALKRAGVPVAGADRLSLSTHIAVEDLVAAGRVALLPEDDLTLAALLKSPFIGLDDEDLLRFAPSRRGSLRQALRQASLNAALQAGPGNERLAAAEARIEAMRRTAREHGVFGFYARLLGPEGGRKALASRLGAEAAEASDEVLRLALAYEQSGEASLPRFLDALQTSGADIKRDLSAARGEVRVMTVHGAKGLEAPIVILADACAASDRTERFLALPASDGSEIPVWVPRKELDCAESAQARAAEAANRAREDRRLLYVAMTRARDRLVIAGCPVRGKIPEASWYAMVERGLAAAPPPGLVELAARPGEASVRRWRGSGSVRTQPPSGPISRSPPAGAPAWLRRDVAPEPVAKPPLRPSSALDAADGAASPELRFDRQASFNQQALLAGRFAHALIEQLPQIPQDRRAAAAEILAGKLLAGNREAGLAASRKSEITAKVLDLISAPATLPLFSPDSLAEVSVTGDIRLADGSSRAVSGRIDRLSVTKEGVLIADFKTNLPASGAARDRALVQLAIYRELVRDLYPGRSIGCVLILLDGPSLIRPGDAELDRALRLLSKDA
ncbi:DNA helicase/exodeoxyribonuclease V, subunit A [Rhizobiales bacterium GAS113]|nr:DNA helicase/exodeoxyribonuclease V, subunit A [Rhizobiales bacterium GAS113]